MAWTGDSSLSGLEIKGEGVPPVGSDQVAIDKATADREDFVVGDTITVLTDTGSHEFTITALVGLGDTDGFAGATLAAWDVSTAADVLGAGDSLDGVDVAVADGVDVATVQSRIEEILPPGTEVITRDVLVEENKADLDVFINAFQTGLLIFAFITAFVSAFLINNVFQITIGQRLRELALLRAVGASGTQVRRMIYVEALVMSVVATAIGILGGVGVAKLMLSLFNSAGLGFPDAGTVLLPRSIIMAVVVGVGITLLSVVVPARRAAKIPPVAAMRPELGFEALSTRRLVVGTTIAVVGAVMFVLGLFLRPGGALGLIGLAGVGALMIFLGVASVSSTVARPVTKAIGWPVAKVLGTPGVLARENAGRAPRRTSATAAALMIGVALVSAAAVFASSLRATFTDVLEDAVQADYIVTDESFQGLPPIVAETLAEVPELSAVTPVRMADAQIAGEQRGVGAANPLAVEQLLNLDVIEGGYQGVADGGVLVNEDSAEDLDLSVGDDVSMTFQNGAMLDLPVAGIFADTSLGFGGWLISLDTLEQVTDPSTSPRLLHRRQARRRRHSGAGRRCRRRSDGAVPASQGPEQRRVPGSADRSDRPAADHHHGPARVRHRHRRARDLDHLGARRVRTDTRDRADAGRRDDAPPDQARGALGGRDRLDVRRHRRHRRRHADRSGAVAGRPRRRDRPHRLRRADDRDHPDRSRHRRPDRCPLPIGQGEPDEHPPGDRHGMSAGYSGTPLAKKLGIVEGTRFAVKSDPPGFAVTLGPLPVGVERVTRVRGPLDVVIGFFTARSKLVAAWPALTQAVAPSGSVWVAWPKRSSGVPTDITENTLREDLLPSGWVDTKVCAIDETWSGLRFALRKELRPR